MKHLINQAIGIDQGDDVLFSDYEDGGAMWTATGTRERRVALRFAQPFKSVPAVHAALSMWDMDNTANARADLSVEEVKTTGFVAVFRTWGDTRIARARVSWMAIGETFHEDDWKELY